MSEEIVDEGKVVHLFGGPLGGAMGLPDEEEVDASCKPIFEKCIEANFSQTLVVGIDDVGSVSFVSNLDTAAELVFLIERVKHSLITMGDE